MVIQKTDNVRVLFGCWLGFCDYLNGGLQIREMLTEWIANPLGRSMHMVEIKH
jgi:hypothetical protein